jgi:RHS repeat-associated protein
MGGATTSYIYDAEGMRVRASGAVSATYVWDRQGGLPGLLSDGTTGYVNDESGQVLEERRSGAANYPLSDALGSVREVTDSGGAVVGQAAYDVYGGVRASSGVLGSLGYAGQLADPSGLQYLRARHYDPGTGRFLSADSVINSAPGTQGLNRYTYALGNPSTLTDPSGNAALSEYTVRMAAVAGVVGGGLGAVFCPAGQSRVGCAIKGALLAILGALLFEGLLPLAGGASAGFGGTCLVGAGASVGADAVGQILENHDSVTELVESAALGCATAGAGYGIAKVLGRFRPTPPMAEEPFTFEGEPAPPEPVPAEEPVPSQSGGGGGAEPEPQPQEQPEGVGCTPNSFEAGTPVLMGDGSHKAIDQIQVGDTVQAEDPTTGVEKPEQVDVVIAGQGLKHLVEITVDGEKITATTNHPFYLPDQRAWVQAGDLKVGDRLLLADGREATVQALRTFDRTEKVYNLTVHDLHTYFVGVASILVHNCGKISYEPGASPNQNEIDNGQFLAGRGYDLTYRAIRPDQPSPDYEISGNGLQRPVLADAYAPTTARSNGILNELYDKFTRQGAELVVLDMRESTTPYEALGDLRARLAGKTPAISDPWIIVRLPDGKTVGIGGRVT